MVCEQMQWERCRRKGGQSCSSFLFVNNFAIRYTKGREEAAIREGKERERGVHDVKNRRKEGLAGWLSECDLGREFTMQYQWNTSPPRQPSSASSIVWFNRNCFMKRRLACGIKEKLVLEGTCPAAAPKGESPPLVYAIFPAEGDAI